MLTAAGAIPFAAAHAQSRDSIIVTRDVKIPMRLGAPLKARVYRRPGPQTAPVILSIEIDTSAARDRLARAFAAAGFAVVIADPRAGDDKHVGRDGYDAIEWTSGQPWCDRRVVLEGTGDGANAAWNAAREHPPALTAMLTRSPSRLLPWSDQNFADITVPVLMIAGAYGEPQGSAVGTFTRYARAAATGGARAAFLTVGTIGAADSQLLEKQYFDFLLGRGGIPALLRNRVNYMALNDGSWHSAETLEEIGAVFTSYPLHHAVGADGSPSLGERARDEEPADTLLPLGRVYETPVGAPLPIAGFPSVTLWIAATPAADVTVLIEEVRADQSVLPLGSSAGQTKLAEGAVPGAPSRWEFSGFGSVATTLAKGSKLQLRLRAPAGTVVFHDVERYSRLILPVVKSH